jgi:molybdopterin-binding protein
MKISARNVLKGKVKSAVDGPGRAVVVITLASGGEFTSVITESAAKELKTGSVLSGSLAWA